MTLVARHQLDVTALAEPFTAARLQTLAVIAARATFTSFVALVVGVPFGLWLATMRHRALAYVALMALILPFFLNDGVKAFYWAKALEALHSALRGLPLAESLSPYDPVAPFIPMILNGVPIAASVTAAGYAISVSSRITFFNEVSPERARHFIRGGLPLLAPYILLGGLLCFGLNLSAFAEQQYLGGGMSNNLRTLMLSVVRAGAGPTQVFVLAVLAAVVAMAVAATGAMARQGSNSLARRAYLLTRAVRQPLWPHAARLSPSIGIPRLLPWRTLGAVYGMSLLSLSWTPLGFGLAEGLIACDVERCRFSLSALHIALASDRGSAALATSLQLGVIGAGIGTVLGAIGLLIGVYGHAGRALIVALLAYLLLPADSIGIAVGQIARLAGVDNGSLALASLGQVTVILPYCLAFGIAGGISLPRRAILSLEEFRPGLTLPIVATVMRLGASTLVSSGLFGFVLALNEAVRTSYLIGTREGITQLVAAYQSAGRISGPSDATGLTALLILVGVGALGIAGWLSYRTTIEARRRVVRRGREHGKANA